MTIGTAAVLLTFTLEWSLRKWIKHMNQATLAAVASNDSTIHGKDEEMETVRAADLAERAEALENVVIAYTFEAGIIFHSATTAPFVGRWPMSFLLHRNNVIVCTDSVLWISVALC